MAMAAPARLPAVAWAQRRDLLYLTFESPGGKTPKVSVRHDGGAATIEYRCDAAEEGAAPFACDLELFGDVNESETKVSVTARGMFMVAAKTESGPHWPRLLKAAGKAPNHVKVDFAKFIDEDEEEEELAPGEVQHGTKSSDIQERHRCRRDV